jgi:hypothetical protein
MDKWSLPYQKPNSHSDIFRFSGIYIIRMRDSKEIVYIGMSKSSIYKALYHHFNKWVDCTCRRVTYQNREDYEVRTIKVPINSVDYVERRLIKFFRPRNNAMLYLGVDEIPEPEWKNDFYNNLVNKELQICSY